MSSIEVCVPDIVDHIAVQVYGPRHQLLGHFKIPVALIPNAAQVLVECQQRNPAYSWESFMRWVFRLGVRGVVTGLRTKVPLPPP